MSASETFPGRPESDVLAASFRDPSGFLFQREGVIYRQVNQSFAAEYDRLMDSGLYKDLVSARLLIPHQEMQVAPKTPVTAYKVIQPERVPFISYPYEWSFSQLKDAALTTLKVQQRALNFGMSLKDASSHNIQFHLGHPVLIDSLSFETYQEGKAWDAYRQFCQHFLAPLALMATRDIALSQLLRVHIDGIPLELASRLLPARTRLSLPLLMHIHLHSATQRRYAADTSAKTGRQVSRTAFLGLLDSLRSGVKGLRWQPGSTEWSGYYHETNYTAAGLEHKQHLVAEYLNSIQPAIVWDLGANTGLFSRIASDRGIFTVAFDIDPGAVELNYLATVKQGEKTLLPLLQDLTNPSAGIGWDNRERQSLEQRGPADAILALALIHHLAIANNVPLDMLATFFRKLGGWLVIEFIPKTDSQVQRLLATRADIFPNYTTEGFEHAFSRHFRLHRCEPIADSQRLLYLMEGI